MIIKNEVCNIFFHYLFYSITGKELILNLEAPIGTSSIDSVNSSDLTGLSINSPARPVSSIFQFLIFLPLAFITIGESCWVNGKLFLGHSFLVT